MSPLVSVRRNRITQKCVIPAELLQNSNLRICDYVKFKSSDQTYICQMYSSVNSSKHLNIVVDDSVTVNKKENRRAEGVLFPYDISAINVLKFDYVQVKIIFRDGFNALNCSSTVYHDVVREILLKYVITSDCTVNCSASSFADLFHIQSIAIVKAFPGEHMYGKLMRSSVVEILDVMTAEQMKQHEKFSLLDLGGMKKYSWLLKHYLIQPGKTVSILVSGPSGCGKSTLVKKFCSETELFLVYIDGLQKDEFSKEKCDMYRSQISNYLNIFPNRNCVLFIDSIDIMTPSGVKESSVLLTATLLRNLKDIGVSFIATAMNRRNIHCLVASFFEREISMGIPSRQERRDMIEALTISQHPSVDCDKIALLTPGFIGHDISKLVKEALKIKHTRYSEESALTTEDLEEAVTNISPSILKSSTWNFKVQPVYWKDIGGVFHVKQRLRMCIELPLKNPEIFKKLDLPCPRGILLFGPPGCCKTTLARGLATECNANFFAANPAQIYSPYVGESEKNITELFYYARLAAPSIIFLDELDTLVARRQLDSKSQGVAERVLSTLLNEMDGFGTTVEFQNNLNMQKLILKRMNKEEDSDQNSNVVIVVGATNRPDLIDSALLRPGRFDVILYVPPPSTEERESILKTLTKHMPVKDIDFKSISEKTNLYSGADLKNLCHEAGMSILRSERSTAECISTECFYEALETIRPSITRQQIEMYESLSMKYDPVSERLGDELRSDLNE